MVSLKCKKIFCVIYSGLLFISGIILIVVSSVLLYRFFHHFDYMPGSIVGPLIVSLLLGIGHLFLTWLGIKGPTLEHTFHIILFIIFTIILIIIEFTIGVWTMVLRDAVGTHSVDLLTEAFNDMIQEKYYNSNFAKVQSELECCGLEGPINYVRYEEDAIKLSYMSCKDNKIPNNGGTIQPYQDGCQDVFPSYVQLLLLECAILAFVCILLHCLGLYVIISFYRTLSQERSKRAERRAQIQRQLSGQSQQSQTSLPQPQIGAVPPPACVTPLLSTPPPSEMSQPVRPPRERSATPHSAPSAPPKHN
ncbi:uncharacterized protein LOC130452733 [Diorhabda sublineata]|uniref:uncharacterized protein LOC130452733 n=1 Tax=Diorhabda sublineata TaxID=1163346 RepID=UPI0024E0BC50|nr:uncharacterized protein LOC130452733 [Diorhabda sublineata]